MATRAVTLDFGTAANFDVGGNSEMVSGSYRLLDPFHKLPWNSRHWSTVPPLNGSTYEANPADGVEYLAMNGSVSPSQFDIQDGLFTYWVRASNVTTADGLYTYVRRDPINAATHFDFKLAGDNTGACDLKCFSNAGINLEFAAWWSIDWTIGEWRYIQVKVLGTIAQFRMENYRDFWYRQVDVSNSGAFALLCDDAATPFYLGADVTGEGDPPSDKVCPSICVRHVGSMEMATAAPYAVPADVTSLGYLTAQATAEWMPDNATASQHPFYTSEGVPLSFPVFLKYRLSTGGWVALADNGDLSGISDPGGQNIWFGIGDTTGTGLDNAMDTRYRPVVHSLTLTEVGTQATGQPYMHQRRKPILRRRG